MKFVVAAAAVLVLSACSGAGSGGDSATDGTIPETASTPATVTSVAPTSPDRTVADQVSILSLSMSSRLPWSLADALAERDELTLVVSASVMPVSVAGEEWPLLALSDPAALGVLNESSMTAGSLAALDQAGTVVVAASTAEARGLDLGDVVDVEFADGAATQLRIVGLTDDTQLGPLTVSVETVADRRDDLVVVFIRAARPDDVDEASAKAAVEEVLENHPDAIASWWSDLPGNS